MTNEINKAYQDMCSINEELSQFSWKTIAEFRDMFRCDRNDPNAKMYEVLCKEYCDEQKEIKKKLKSGLTNEEELYSHYCHEIIYMTSFEDFWYRWNKFKKLMVFI